MIGSSAHPRHLHIIASECCNRPAPWDVSLRSPSLCIVKGQLCEGESVLRVFHDNDVLLFVLQQLLLTLEWVGPDFFDHPLSLVEQGLLLIIKSGLQ